MSSGGCCGSRCCRWFWTVFYYIAAVSCLAYLIYCIVAIPQYRYVAIILIALILVLQFSLWRFLPSERRRVREKGEGIASARLSGTDRRDPDELHAPYA